MSPWQAGLVLAGLLALASFSKYEVIFGIFLVVTGWNAPYFLIDLGSRRLPFEWALIAIVGGLALLRMTEAKSYVISERAKLTGCFILFWAAWITLTSALNGFKGYTFGLAFYFPATRYVLPALGFWLFIRDARGLRAFALAFVAASVLYAGVLMWLVSEVAAWSDEHWESVAQHEDALTFFYHSPAWMLTFAIIFTIIFILRPAVSGRPILARALWLPVLGFLYYALFFTGSRQATIGVLVASAVLLVLLLRTRFSTVVVVGLTAAAAVGALMYLVSTDPERMRFEMLGEGVTSRWANYETMLSYFDRSPLIGCGLFYDPEQVHNIFLDALAGQGLPGLLFLTGFLALGLRFTRGTAWRRCETEFEMWRLGAVAIFAALFWCAQVSMGVMTMNTLLWGMLLVWRLHEIRPPEPATEGVEPSRVPSGESRRTGARRPAGSPPWGRGVEESPSGRNG